MRAFSLPSLSNRVASNFNTVDTHVGESPPEVPSIVETDRRILHQAFLIQLSSHRLVPSKIASKVCGHPSVSPLTARLATDGGCQLVFPPAVPVEVSSVTVGGSISLKLRLVSRCRKSRGTSRGPVLTSAAASFAAAGNPSDWLRRVKSQ